MTEYYTCGNCNVTKSYDEDFPALSRKDNKTDICSKCGQEEAMKEYVDWKWKKLIREGSDKYD